MLIDQKFQFNIFRATLFMGALFMCCSLLNAQRPGVILTSDGVERIKSKLGSIPLLDQTLAAAIEEVDDEMKLAFEVPIPKHLGGGYTHDRHKRNYFILQKAGVIFQLTGDEKYGQYVLDGLKAYAALYPTYDQHPSNLSYAPGKFFWQSLNDANWLVYMSQAYDCIYDWINKDDRKHLNENLFRPHAEHLALSTPRFFNRIHNHSAWGNAAVGMAGLVIGDKELIQWALYGANNEIPGDKILDENGNFLELPEMKEAGFIANIDGAFSPDGYYTEGPYYQRYAMLPYMIFSQALANKIPEAKIYSYRDGILLKAVYAILSQTNTAGKFFPVNDALKGMSYKSRELIKSVGIAYHFGGQDPRLLSVALNQGKVTLDDAGLSLAMGLANGKAKPFNIPSIQLTDGANGKQGGLGILRSTFEDGEASLVMKYTRQGGGHGHFDKLAFTYFHNENEVFQDYGSARWVNIEQKGGGRYLPENRSWAKQTIAHNTVVVNQKTQFNGIVKNANRFHGDPYFFKTGDEIQVMSAKENNAYGNTKMHRTMALIKHESFDAPVVLDVFRIQSDTINSYDLPYYYNGHVMLTNFDYHKESILSPLGEEHGYQHLWKTGEGSPSKNGTKLSWFNNDVFYSLTASSLESDKLLFARIGANDPNFNLRNDPAFIIRRENISGNTVFASTYEIHGKYSQVAEVGTNTYSSISSVEVVLNNNDYTVVKVTTVNKEVLFFAVSNNDNSVEKIHDLKVDDLKLNWKGPFLFLK